VVRATGAPAAAAGNRLTTAFIEEGGGPEGTGPFLRLSQEGTGLSTDHGYKVDEDKRCTATTKKQKQCSMNALVGSPKCALHSGLARPNRDSGHGNPQALEAFKRSLLRGEQPSRGRPVGRPGLSQ